MTISVVIPTIKARAAWLDRCVAAYKRTCPKAQIIVVANDDRSCGEAWIEGAEQATGDYLHFTADDLIPLRGWWQAAKKVVDAGDLPTANVLTAQLPNGDWNPDSTMSCYAWLTDDVATPNVLVPFFAREQFEMDGDGHSWLAPIHYGSDDWVTFLAARRGLKTVFAPEYRLGHGAAAEGRLWNSRERDIPILCDLMASWGRPPNQYALMGATYGWPTQSM